MKFVTLIGLFLTLPLFASNYERLMDIKEVTRFTFGSCNDQTDPQPMWDEMLKVKPDFFMWGGDNVYADREFKKDLKRAFDRQDKDPYYQNFKKQIPIMGVWDDHDFGGNDSDGYFPFKEKNQKLFLDFMEEPQDSPRRKRPGIYTSYDFGRVKFLLLDNRYFLHLDSKAPILGEAQWQWLENELKNSRARVHFIMSGITVLSPFHPFVESWSNHKNERKRLFRLLKKYQTSGVVFLTGDMHFSSIFQKHGHLEFLASGMTHRSPRVSWWYLGNRYETSFFGLNYGMVDVEWRGDTPVLSMVIRNRRGEEFHRRTFQLQGNRWIREHESGFNFGDLVTEDLRGHLVDRVD